MEGERMVRKRNKVALPKAPAIEFRIAKNSSLYLQNATNMLSKAASIAELTYDTETLLHIAGAWLDIAKETKVKKKPKAKQLSVGFAPLIERGIIEEEETEYEDE
jgi:hypothetical protein